MSTDLDDVFGPDKAEQPAPEPQAEPTPAPPPEPEAPAEPAPEPEEAQAEPAPGDRRTVPLAALEGERKARQDWKDRAARAETEAQELRKQLDEARKPAPVPQHAPAPLTAEDYANNPGAVLERVQQVVLNERLNTSEMMLRQSIGAEKVDAAIAEFKAEAAKDPALFGKLYSQPDPYGWMHKEVERRRAFAEIGENPAEYRARLEAEIRAKLEAEMGGQAPAAPAPQPSAAPRAPSLAGVRSAMPRSAPVVTGNTPLGNVLPNG